MKHKVLFNVGNIIKGGAIQAAVNFITTNQKNRDDIFQWYFILSKEVAIELQKAQIDIDNNVLILDASPAKNSTIQKQMLTFQEQNNVQLAFSLFGPSYANFSCPHVSGFANGWLTHSTLQVFCKTYKNHVIKIVKAILKYIYYGFHIRKADGWIFETNTAMKGFIKRLRVNPNRCYVVPNTSIDFGKSFVKQDTVTINQITLQHSDRLFVALAADYPQKNLFSLLQATRYLTKSLKQENFKLLLTLSNEAFNQHFLPYIKQHQLEAFVINLGHVSIADLPALYSVAYSSILPSYIETFSAVYPESFATETPVITTDAEFAREICQDAALYIDPNNPTTMAEAMNKLLVNHQCYNELTIKGKKYYQAMLTPEQKHQAYLDVLRAFLK